MSQEESEMKVLLASQSERRRQLLKKIVPEFIIDAPWVEEILDERIPAEQIAMMNAERKAKNVASKHAGEDYTIIAADTIVVVNDKILGKPADKNTAYEYLKILSGSWHRVITGVCLMKVDENKMIIDFDTTFVKFRNLSDEQIKTFLEKETFYDKAGAYAVQELDDAFVEKIKGSYDNVVGLPVEKLKNLLNLLENLDITEIYDIALPNIWGIGKKNEKIIFIDHTVPGDTVWFYVAKDKGSFAYGVNCGIKKYSEFRVNPECPHFGRCGGCSFQNLNYKFQIELKKKYVIETLARIGKIKLENEIPVIESPLIFNYRNKMEYAFGSHNGKIVLGLRERQNPLKRYRGSVNNIEKCLIFSDIVEKLFPVSIRYVEENSFSPYNPFTKNGLVRHLVIRRGINTAEFMVIFVTKSGINRNIEKLAESMVGVVPEIKSFWWVENDQISDVVNYQQKHLIYGNQFIEETLFDYRFRIYPETFFQPNTKAAEKLYGVIVSMAQEVHPESVLGLFCGSGPIEILLSRISHSVTGVDNNPSNIVVAKENCDINNITNCVFHCISAEQFLKNARDRQHKYDLLVVDPPRGGLTNKAMFHLLRVKIPKIIYVSCNVSTLARDLSILMDNGYQLKKFTAIDMFPHTGHIESCCLLEMK